MKFVENSEPKAHQIVLALLLVAPGLYASEADFKAHSAVINAELAEHDGDEDPAVAELGRLAKQTPEQTAQADKLHAAISDEDTKAVQALLDSKVDVNVRSFRNNPALCRAFTPGMVKLLLDHKADPNGIDTNKKTALHWHCFKVTINKKIEDSDATKECFLLLLDHRANVDAQDTYGYTPLCSLVPSMYSHFQEDYVTLFLEHGANPNIPNVAKNIPNVAKHTVLDLLRRNLESDDYFDKKNLRVPTCKMMCILDTHDKQVREHARVIDEALMIMSKDVVNIISGYAWCGKQLNTANRAKLDAIFRDFKWLFDQLRKEGLLS